MLKMQTEWVGVYGTRETSMSNLSDVAIKFSSQTEFLKLKIDLF